MLPNLTRSFTKLWKEINTGCNESDDDPKRDDFYRLAFSRYG